MKKRYASNASLFAKRGDPWVSRKEGEKDFNRNLETENPDYDRYFRAKAPKERQPYVDPKPERKRDYIREKQKIVKEIQDIVAPKPRHVKEARMASVVFRPCPGCRKAICIAKSVCIGIR